MKSFEKLWDLFILLTVVFALLWVTYVAAFVKEPTNAQLADCILYASCVLLWRMNTIASLISKNK